MPDNVKKIRDLNDFDVNTPISKDDFLIVATKEGSVPATNKATIEAIMSAYSAGATDGSDTTTDPDGNTIVDPSKKPGVDIDNGNGGTLRQDTTPATAQNIDQFVQGEAGSGGGSSGLITIEECRDIALSVVDCTDPSVAYKTKKLSIDPEGMIDGGANSNSGLITVEECRNASNTIVDCADPSVVYRTKKLSLDLGAHEATHKILAITEIDIPLFSGIQSDRTTTHNYGGGNNSTIPNTSFDATFKRKFLRHEIEFNNKGVRSDFVTGCGDFMSAAVYHKTINDWWINTGLSNIPSGDPPMDNYRPSHPNLLSQFPNASAMEFYTLYKKFGALIDYGTFSCTPEDIKGYKSAMWIRPYPFLDSNDSWSNINGKAWLGLEMIVRSRLIKGLADADLSIWSFIPVDTDVGVVTSLGYVHTHSKGYPWYFSDELDKAGLSPWFHWALHVYGDPNGNIGYRKNDIYVDEWSAWTTIQALSQFVLDGTVPTGAGGSAPPANTSTSPDPF